MGREQVVFEIAAELGFDLCGIAPLAPPPDAQRFQAWLDQGRHGSMRWLEVDAERILDPRKILKQPGSMVVLGLAHSRPAVELQGGGRVARYAAGRDYHNVLAHKLRKFSKRLERAGLGGMQRRIVDAGPVLERSHARVAGVGFASKAANLLHPRFGPYFFLSELLLSHELEPTSAELNGSCGTCTACLDACPTQAIVAPGEVDARRCISYLTIEHQGAMDPALRDKVGQWAFGCDVCSEVCPWASKAPDLSQRFGHHRAVAELGLVEWLEAGEAFGELFHPSPTDRPGREGVARNAAIALSGVPSERGRGALLKALSFDPSQVVREAAAWSLAKAHAKDDGVQAALERAAAAEADPAVKAAILEWRGRCT